LLGLVGGSGNRLRYVSVSVSVSVSVDALPDGWFKFLPLKKFQPLW
jgi:hypothetical protein